jgi:sugar phosphate isomerase/epimerase
MPETAPVVWIYSDSETIGFCNSLVDALGDAARPLILGPGESEWAHVKFGEDGDFISALDTCPPELRPNLCVNTSHKPPRGMDCLPCSVLGMDGASGLDGQLVESPQAMARQILAEAKAPYAPDWLKMVQVNLPLKDLVGKYAPLANAYPINLEVGIDAYVMDVMGQDALDRGKKMVQGRRVTVHMPFFDLVPGSTDKRVSIAAFTRLNLAADWALKLEAEQAVIHLGMDPNVHPDVQAYAKRFANNLRPVFSKLNQGGCRVVLENTYDKNPRALLTLMEMLTPDHQIGVCLDVGHVSCFSNTALPDWWQALAPFIREMHLHDNNGQSDQHHPIGWESVDWGFLHDHLAELNPHPILTLEPHSEPHLWASLRGLQRLWGELWKW